MITERHALFKQFDNVLHTIRSLQGFENFLKWLSKSELLSLANDGAIIVFNVSDIRSDTFLITTDEIRSLHLPLLRSDALEYFTKQFITSINNRNPNHYSHSRHEVNAVL